METILKCCRVPWDISPTTDGLTLYHMRDDIPTCTVVLGGNRLVEGKYVSCRVEIKFEHCSYARVGRHADDSGIEELLGYRVERDPEFEVESWFEAVRRVWESTGNCPITNFCVARQSAWLFSLDDFFRERSRHYVIDGRDGYIELIAESFSWQAWNWKDGPREEAPLRGPVVASGQGVE
jgi:hypothetical protein